jgi:outer membrane receptor protein involved in Fe transport
VPANDLLVQPADKYAVHGVQAEYEPTWTILGAKKTSLKVSVDNLFDTAYRPVTSFLYQPGMDVRTSLSLKF